MKRIFKVKEIISILISQGWYLDRQRGSSHRQFKHPTIRKTVTVDGKLSLDVDEKHGTTIRFEISGF
jgi:predicted RNA binding protein YcfA (HicA-like mRNA interferase family)